MKITITKLSKDAYYDRDERDFYQIETPKNKLRFLDGEPEDANINGDFSDVLDIPDLIREVRDAVKNGEDIEFATKEVDKPC